MELKWYIVNTQTGCENTAKLSIEKRIKESGLKDQFGQVLVPTEDVVELRKGKRTTRTRKFFPGYLFVEMDMCDKTWHLVKSSTKVSGFVGHQRPTPVPPDEVSRITRQMETGGEVIKPKVNFVVGENIVVIDGPFSNFNGSVEEINEDKAKVKVLVSIFGRPTPVELDFVQVEKV